MSLRLPVRVRACAKLNLTLRVLGVRADGYHELRTVFQSLALHDQLTVEPTSSGFAIACDDPTCPIDRSNLVWRAADAVWRAAGRCGAARGVRVSIRKRIPMQAGLGGGSSDAAAVLRVCAALWCPRLDMGELERLGASLGADVPFFLRGGTALGVERGDRLFSLVDGPRSWVVLAQPAVGVSSAHAYRWFDQWAARARYAAVPRDGFGPYGDGGNDLQGPVEDRHPIIRRLVRALTRQGAQWAAMSGSGSVCFGLFSSRAAALAASTALNGRACRTLVTRTQTAGEYARCARPLALPLRTRRRLAGH
jgi:4-diphosphocytidyl-2-C-methyl-D-erythritol kinase